MVPLHPTRLRPPKNPGKSLQHLHHRRRYRRNRRRGFELDSGPHTVLGSGDVERRGCGREWQDGGGAVLGEGLLEVYFEGLGMGEKVWVEGQFGFTCCAGVSEWSVLFFFLVSLQNNSKLPSNMNMGGRGKREKGKKGERERLEYMLGKCIRE